MVEICMLVDKKKCLYLVDRSRLSHSTVRRKLLLSAPIW